MIPQTTAPPNFDQQARKIKAQVMTTLTKWGLLPRFKRWRLTQDPGTGMIVLFGVLNNRYIATHTSIPFSDYFDPRVLHDLANELQLQVVSCNSDGLRYAFILDRGQLGRLPTHVDFPFVANGKILARVVYSEQAQPVPTAPVETEIADDQTLVREGVGAFLKIFDDIKLRDDAALQPTPQDPPEVVIMNADDFHQLIAEHEAKWQRSKRIRELFGKKSGQS